MPSSMLLSRVKNWVAGEPRDPGFLFSFLGPCCAQNAPPIPKDLVSPDHKPHVWDTLRWACKPNLARSSLAEQHALAAAGKGQAPNKPCYAVTHS